MYDFDKVFDRRRTGSAKWDMMEREMGDKREEVIALSVADMDFKAAPEIIAAIKEKVDFGIYGYTVPTESYYEAVVGWMERRHDWKIEKEWVSLSQGIVPAFNTALRAFTHPGDKVIIQQPVYYPFENAIIQNGCQLVNNALLYEDGRYAIDFEDLEQKAKDPRAKVLLFCNPHNPVGRVWTEEELRRVGDICLNNGVLVISDEIHFDFIYRPHKHTVFASLSEEIQSNCLILTAPTKTFNLAGLQVSNIIIPNTELKAQFDTANRNTGFFALNYFAYAACEAAYDKGAPWLDALLSYLEGNLIYLRSFISENIPSIKLIEPEGTYLTWLDCRSLGLAEGELESFMKHKAKLFLDEGYIFGKSGSGFERINIACPRTLLEKALHNLKDAVDSIS